MTPFHALIEVRASFVVIGESSARRAVTLATGQRRSAFVLATQSRARRNRAGRLLVGTILAVTFAVAELGFGDAFGRPVGTSVRAQEFVVGAGDGRAVGFVALVRTVVVSIAVEVGGYAERIGTPELASVTWREI